MTFNATLFWGALAIINVVTMLMHMEGDGWGTFRAILLTITVFLFGFCIGKDSEKGELDECDGSRDAASDDQDGEYASDGSSVQTRPR